MGFLIIIVFFIVIMIIVGVAINSAQNRKDNRTKNFQNLGKKFGLTHSIEKTLFEKNNVLVGEIDGQSIRIFDEVRGAGKYSLLYVRIVFDPNPFTYDFTLGRKGFYPMLRKITGSKEFEIGHPAFDASFIVTSSNPKALIAILNNDVRQALFSIEDSIQNKIKSDAEGLTYEIKNGLSDERGCAEFENVITFMRILIAHKS